MQKLINRMSLKFRLLFFILTIAIISISFIALISYNKSKTALTDLSINQLSAQGSITSKRLSNYLEQTVSTTKSLSHNRLIEGLFVAYESNFYGSGFDPGEDLEIYNDYYKNLDKKYIKRKESLIKEFKIKDIFIVTTSGQLVFTADNATNTHYLGKNLENGYYTNTPLGKCYRDASTSSNNDVFFSDFFFNELTKSAAAYLCTKKIAEFDNMDEGISKGDAIGVIAIKIDQKYMNSIISERVGMGETGQAYLIGHDKKLRSNFYLAPEKFNINKSLSSEKLTTSQSIELALAGKTGSIFTTDPLNESVISFHMPFEFMGNKWALITEKRESEIFAPISSMVLITFLSSIAIFIGITFLSTVIVNRIVNPILNANISLDSISNNLSTGASDLQGNSSTLNEGSEQLSSAITETVASMDELTAMVNQTLNNVEESNNSSIEMTKNAKQGKQSILKMKSAVGEISQNNDQIVGTMNLVIQHMEEFKKVITEISDKTKMINDVVFQTKLLSFNASVEAARAGENGKGFSVVAEEVGNLANASGRAADEIAVLLQDNIKRVDDIVSDTSTKIEGIKKTGKDKIDEGNSTAEQCELALNTILENVQDVSSKINSISNASTEQAAGIREVNDAMNSLNEIAHQTTNIAGLNSESASDLTVESNKLQSIFSMLNQLVIGSNAKSLSPTISNEDNIEDTPSDDETEDSFSEEALFEDDNGPNVAS